MKNGTIAVLNITAVPATWRVQYRELCRCHGLSMRDAIKQFMVYTNATKTVPGDISHLLDPGTEQGALNIRDLPAKVRDNFHSVCAGHGLTMRDVVLRYIQHSIQTGTI